MRDWLTRKNDRATATVRETLYLVSVLERSKGSLLRVSVISKASVNSESSQSPVFLSACSILCEYRKLKRKSLRARQQNAPFPVIFIQCVRMWGMLGS